MKKLLIIIISIFLQQIPMLSNLKIASANKLVKEKIDKIKPSSVSKIWIFRKRKMDRRLWYRNERFWRHTSYSYEVETPRTPEQEKLAEEFYREEKKLFKIALLEYNDKYRSKYYDQMI